MPVKSRTVRLTPPAETDLEGIWSYTVERWSPEQAERYVGEFAAAFERLACGEWLGRPRKSGAARRSRNTTRACWSGDSSAPVDLQ
ncbi:type II toxin-antitoxin system RelE/ParE family toxin [Burkholderia paludis]|uniref:type II toxin-antitoxin system RelE/ParE family toxin n=1 Tax=Burkholderia paludis TaxID=1506587 RepID=UPI000946F442|nr:type II toxin-antitoxin system RelE/ParE family toxin [Burkholderia paludis]